MKSSSAQSFILLLQLITANLTYVKATSFVLKALIYSFEKLNFIRKFKDVFICVVFCNYSKETIRLFYSIFISRKLHQAAKLTC